MQLLYSCATFDKILTVTVSCSPSTIAELLVEAV